MFNENIKKNVSTIISMYMYYVVYLTCVYLFKIYSVSIFITNKLMIRKRLSKLSTSSILGLLNIINII